MRKNAAWLEALMKRAPLAVLTLASLTIGACSSGADKKTDSARTEAGVTGGADLTGAGATFPFPLYSRWVSEYAAATGVKINYQQIGSGGGIKQLQEETVDFGASDAPMSDSDIARAKGGAVIHIPTVVGVVAIAYNLPQVSQPLKLSGPVVADIFLGKITKWNDSRIASLNSGVTLPNADVLVVHRSEGSGTTYIFSDYLSSVSAAWKSSPGKGKEVSWPVGIGERGNDGVAGRIKQTPGSIGYVELAYVKQNRLTAALLQNASGQFVAPSADAATAAADAAIAMLPANTDYRVSIINTQGTAAYPITSFTYLLVYQHMADAAKAQKLQNFIKWALTTGQKDAATLDYAPLPASMIPKLTARIDAVSAGTK
jgi:phosphate transport system substrate-binding protein